MPDEAVNLVTNLDELQRQRGDIYSAINNIINNAAARGDDLNDDEAKKVEDFQSEHRAIDRRIKLYEQQIGIQEEMQRPPARATAPDEAVDLENPQQQATAREQSASGTQNAAGRPTEIRSSRFSGTRVIASPTHGFESMGHWCMSVVEAAGGRVDDRLSIIQAASTSQESFGDAGGYLVPPEFSTMIIKAVLEDEMASLASYAFQLPITGNYTSVPINLDTPWGDGIQAYWGNEGEAHKRSAPIIEGTQTILAKLTALVPVTEELVMDAPAIGALIREQAPKAIAWQISNTMINGDGVRKPLGALTDASPCRIVVAKENGQEAKSITRQNVFEMISHVPPEGQMKAVWLCSLTAQPKLLEVLFQNKNQNESLSSGVPLQILQRPVIPHIAMQSVGEVGDIALCDFSKYLFVFKQGGVRSAMSMHMMFDRDTYLFKFQIRCNGQPSWTKAIDLPHEPTHKLAPFVVLGERK